MSKSEILYVKGMNMSESDEDDSMNSAWDDKKLKDAYDKAVKIANAEVAKRVAMSTNTQHNPKEEDNSRKKKEKSTAPKPSSSKKKDAVQWKPGMPCRSIYEGDGIEYEAFVLRLINNEECVVRYLGYENSEIVPIDTLRPSHGNDARTKQIEEALHEKVDDGFGSLSPNLIDEMESSDRVPSPDSMDRAAFQKKKRPSKKKKANTNNNFVLPEMPMNMPSMSMLRNLGSMEMPMPPPPMAFMARGATESEEQAISSMLLSWYMSGYYTGLYQGLKRVNENRRNV